MRTATTAGSLPLVVEMTRSQWLESGLRYQWERSSAADPSQRNLDALVTSLQRVKREVWRKIDSFFVLFLKYSFGPDYIISVLINNLSLLSSVLPSTFEREV